MSNTASATSTRRTPEGWSELEGDRQFATTLARGLELLRCFTPESCGVDDSAAPSLEPK